jgi:hypothetical protein
MDSSKKLDFSQIYLALFYHFALKVCEEKKIIVASLKFVQPIFYFNLSDRQVFMHIGNTDLFTCTTVHYVITESEG